MERTRPEIVYIGNTPTDRAELEIKSPGHEQTETALQVYTLPSEESFVENLVHIKLVNDIADPQAALSLQDFLIDAEGFHSVIYSRKIIYEEPSRAEARIRLPWTQTQLDILSVYSGEVEVKVTGDRHDYVAWLYYDPSGSLEYLSFDRREPAWTHNVHGHIAMEIDIEKGGVSFFSGGLSGQKVAREPITQEAAYRFSSETFHLNYGPTSPIVRIAYGDGEKILVRLDVPTLAPTSYSQMLTRENDTEWIQETFFDSFRFEE